MIRLGLIGCGEHIPRAGMRSPGPLQGGPSGEIELAAACDPRLERAQFFCRVTVSRMPTATWTRCWPDINSTPASR